MTHKTVPEPCEHEWEPRNVQACFLCGQVRGLFADLADAAPQPTLAAPQEEPRQPSGGSAKLTFTLREAQTLVETFGGDDSMVTVRHLPSGAVASDKHNIDDGGPSPAGLWVHFTEYPEEGCMYLGPGDEVNDDPPAPQPTLAAPLDSAVTDWLRRAREAGSGLQSMLDIDGAELLLQAFSEQRECDRIDLADARGTIKRQETALADAYRQGAAEPAKLLRELIRAHDAALNADDDSAEDAFADERDAWEAARAYAAPPLEPPK